ncbi:MAG: hypothetical protein ACT4QE_06415, partial [Anaerolineales bacterium]
PGEPGWQYCNFSFQIVRNHMYVVVNYSHDDPIDRGVAVAKMRSTMRNLVNWLLLGQSILTEANIALESDEVMAHYEGDGAWVAHIPPVDELTDSKPLGSNDAIPVGVSWLPFLLTDRHLLYALQDYSTSLKYPEFCLFLLWRSVEWILWTFEERTDVNNPAFAPAANTLGLTIAWFEEIGRLAHTHTRHARVREAPETHLLDTARERVRILILRYIDVKHKNMSPVGLEISADSLTGWTPAARH